jgi:hypothetical protein
MSEIAHVYRPRPRPLANRTGPSRMTISIGCAYLALTLAVAFAGAIVLGLIH